MWFKYDGATAHFENETLRLHENEVYVIGQIKPQKVKILQNTREL